MKHEKVLSERKRRGVLLLVSLLFRRKKADLRFTGYLLGVRYYGLLCLCVELPRKPRRRGL